MTMSTEVDILSEHKVSEGFVPDDSSAMVLKSEGPAPLPCLSELSSAVTETSVDSLDVLSPGGTPIHSWFACISPSAKNFEVDYADYDLHSKPFRASYNLVSSIPEEPLNDFPKLETSDAEKLSQESNNVFENTEGASLDEDTLDSIQSRSSEFEVHIASNETPAVTCISSSKAIEVILDDAKIEVTEDNIKEIDYGICSTDLIFAFVWLGLSLAILESHQVDSGVIQRVVVRATEPILEHFGNNTVLYASATGNIVFETFQMINAFWAEVVCSFLGSSCIA